MITSSGGHFSNTRWTQVLASAKQTKSLPGAPNGDYAVMEFDASFAGKKSAVETVTFSLEKDGQWRAVGYHIQ